MPDEIVNKVASSGLITLDLSDYLPKEIVEFDVKEFLFMQIILKEKDFRDRLTAFNWSVFKDKNVAVFCSIDAIIPAWAYMLISSYLQPIVASFNYGNKEATEEKLLLDKITLLDIGQFKDHRIIVKGCGDKAIPLSAYLEITRLLRPIAKSIMYGEACSSVPVYKAR
jgi:hypothetical protein